MGAIFRRKKEASRLPEPDIPIEIDEMWHFLHPKKQKNKGTLFCV